MGSLVAEAPRYNDCSASQDEDDSPDERSPRLLLDQEASGSGHHQVSGLSSSNLTDLETQALEWNGFDHGSSNDVNLGFFGQIRATLVASKLNWLLIFVPIGLAAHSYEVSPLVTFITNAIAIIPLSVMLTDATERIAIEAGDTIGALLNITLGNLVELIILVALVNDHIRIVQASILGSVLVNLLLILGSALLASSMSSHDPHCSVEESELLACLLFISVFVILIPTAFDYTFHMKGKRSEAALSMSRASSLVVLVIYVLYFAYEMRPKAVEALPIPLQTLQPGNARHQSPQRRHRRGPSSQSQTNAASRSIRFADQNAQSRARSTTLDRGSRVNPEIVEEEPVNRDPARPDSRLGSSYQQGFRARGHSRTRSLSASQGFHSRDSSLNDGTIASQFLPEHLHEVSALSPSRPTNSSGTFASVTVLVLTSALMSMNAEFLVKEIDDVTHEGGLSEAMIGLIILPVVGNIAEYVTVVTVATKNKLDLAISVAVGSAIQIALCVAPLTVLIAWMLHRDLEMAFNVFETTTLVGTGLLINLLILSRTSTTVRAVGLKGALMYACYVIIGLGAYYEPSSEK
ncbi:hypothetical protein CDV31_011023 [Fusarium ambrosium]|uniref:Sodium/calcium exchanger membrane region domain-containing protein n=1 Tax=Fusarium ambrosium TaxID=131363 RepID=A0A428TJJ2_9HYPO|nr:hypothetical protein CDV31_011023 [Fusarium ambrosium]